jgi:sigma-B regulation protein RsbU (phosphoserine phosphatase)
LSDPPENVPVEDLADLYENAPFGYLSLSRKGRIVKANRTLSLLIGHAPDALVGLRIHELLNFAGRIYYETHLAPLLRLQGQVNEVALDLVGRDGRVIPVLANAAERRDSNGGLLFTRLAVFQAGDRRRYERDLLSARDRATEAIRDERALSELREQFIAVLGHDLRNPLAAIASGARLLERELLRERAQEIVRLMGGSAARALALIADVLDFARGRLGGGIALSRRPDQPLQTVLEQVVAELRAVAIERSIHSDIALEEPVDCDPVRIGQLVSNLLGNAIVHGAADQPIRITARAAQGRFEISVANGGDPIPEATMANLFQPFFRGDMQGDRQGLGLGLFIAAQIARAHGGDLTVRSAVNETRFDFVMPSISGQAGAPPS